MEAFAKVQSVMKRQPEYGHAERNKRNIESLKKASYELNLMAAKAEAENKDSKGTKDD